MCQHGRRYTDCADCYRDAFHARSRQFVAAWKPHIGSEAPARHVAGSARPRDHLVDEARDRRRDDVDHLLVEPRRLDRLAVFVERLRRELTICERLIILNEMIATELKYALRSERHGDADKKADEA